MKYPTLKMTAFNNNGFPTDFTSKKEKESKAYGNQYAKAIYQNFVYNNSDWDEKRERLIDNRRYAEGLQRISKYKDLLAKDNVFVNLDWSVISVIPVFVDLMVGEIINSDFKIDARAIDPISTTSKDKEKATLLAKMQMKKEGFIDYMKENTGTSVVSDNDYVPGSKDEIELHMQMNFKLGVEVAIEEFIQYVFKSNDHKEFKRKIYRDLITIKEAVGKCFLDENDEIKFRYVDPVNFITSFSKKDDFSDAKFAAEIIYVDISELRRMSKGELSEQDLFEIAKSTGDSQHAKWDFGDSYEGYYAQYGDTYFGYDDFLIPVLDFQFISVDIKTFEEKPNNYGGIYFNQKSAEYESDDPEKKIHKVEVEYKYGGYWCPGSEIIFDYGLKKDILREKKGGAYSSECELDYIMYSPNKYDMENKSLVERMIPYADQIQLVTLKIQQLMLKLKPPGMSVDVNALHSIMLGKGVDTSSMDLLEFYEQSGVFFYNSKDSEGQYSNRPPITELRNAMGAEFQQLTSLIGFNRQAIRDITGINEMRDGISVQEDVSFKTQQASLKASRNATSELNNALMRILEGTARRVAHYTAHLAVNDRLDSYTNVIGNMSVKMLDIKKDMELIEMGIFLEALPDDHEKDLIENNIQIALKQQTIRLEDSITIRDLCKTSTTQANQYLILKQKQYRQEEEEKSAKLQEQNAQIQQQSAEQAHQLKMQEQEMETQKLQLKYQLEDANNQKQHERKLEEIKLEGEVKSVHIEQAADNNFKNTALSNAVKQPRLGDPDPVN